MGDVRVLKIWAMARPRRSDGSGAVLEESFSDELLGLRVALLSRGAIVPFV